MRSPCLLYTHASQPTVSTHHTSRTISAYLQPSPTRTVAPVAEERSFPPEAPMAHQCPQIPRSPRPRCLVRQHTVPDVAFSPANSSLSSYPTPLHPRVYIPPPIAQAPALTPEVHLHRLHPALVACPTPNTTCVSYPPSPIHTSRQPSSPRPPLVATGLFRTSCE